ncbi:MAG: hypothetical protein R3E39_11075 [Anaerolineae bacterium]
MSGWNACGLSFDNQTADVGSLPAGVVAGALDMIGSGNGWAVFTWTTHMNVTMGGKLI